MPNKVKPVDARKTLYMSDLRKLGRIPIRFGSFFESVQHPGQWVVDLEWEGNRRYLTLDGELDRESFKRLPENTDVEIQSVGRSGIDKVAIYRDGRRVDVHAEREAQVTHGAPGTGAAVGIPGAGIPTTEPTTLDQICIAYAKAYRKAIPMVAELDPNAEHGLTADKVANSVLTAYVLANQFARRRPKRPAPDSPSGSGSDGGRTAP